MGQLNWNFDLSGHVFEDSANAKHKLLQYLRSCISNQSFRSRILHRQHRLASSFRLGLSKMPDFLSFFCQTRPRIRKTMALAIWTSRWFLPHAYRRLVRKGRRRGQHGRLQALSSKGNSASGCVIKKCAYNFARWRQYKPGNYNM